MSYCRWSSGDCYVYSDVNDRAGEIRCCSCALPFVGLKNDVGGVYEAPYPPFIARGPREMLRHLEEHRAVGHLVPEYAMKRLRKEARSWKPPKHPVHLATKWRTYTGGPHKGKRFKSHFGGEPLCGRSSTAHFRKLLGIPKGENGHAHHRDRVTSNKKAVTCKECKRRQKLPLPPIAPKQKEGTS